MFEIELKETADLEMSEWKASGDTAAMRRISLLLADIAEHPETGIGKPERLRGALTGCWSRRIGRRDRLVYRVNMTMMRVEVLSVKGHYR